MESMDVIGICLWLCASVKSILYAFWPLTKVLQPLMLHAFMPSVGIMLPYKQCKQSICTCRPIYAPPNRPFHTKSLINNSRLYKATSAAWIKPQVSHLPPKDASSTIQVSSRLVQGVSIPQHSPTYNCNLPFISRIPSTPVLKHMTSSHCTPRPKSSIK